MFSPNCVIVLPSPEITIKSNQVRAFMVKKLKKNMLLYLKHFQVNYSRVVLSSGRIIIYSSEPRRVVSSLRNCFGINGLFLAEEVWASSLVDLQRKVVEVGEGFFSFGTFAVRGKSFSKNFSSKKLEEALGGSLLDAFPRLRVKLRFPEKEVYCLAYTDKAFFYFVGEACAHGMPVGVQGTAGIIISNYSKRDAVIGLVLSILRVGCNIVVVNQESSIGLKEIEDFNCFKPIKSVSISRAKELYSLGDIKAFFSTATNTNQAKMDSELIGVKVFAPFLF